MSCHQVFRDDKSSVQMKDMTCLKTIQMKDMTCLKTISSIQMKDMTCLKTIFIDVISIEERTVFRDVMK